MDTSQIIFVHPIHSNQEKQVTGRAQRQRSQSVKDIRFIIQCPIEQEIYNTSLTRR